MSLERSSEEPQMTTSMYKVGVAYPRRTLGIVSHAFVGGTLVIQAEKLQIRVAPDESSKTGFTEAVQLMSAAKRVIRVLDLDTLATLTGRIVCQTDRGPVLLIVSSPRLVSLKKRLATAGFDVQTRWSIKTYNDPARYVS